MVNIFIMGKVPKGRIASERALETKTFVEAEKEACVI